MEELLEWKVSHNGQVPLTDAQLHELTPSGLISWGRQAYLSPLLGLSQLFRNCDMKNLGLSTLLNSYLFIILPLINYFK